MKLKKFLRFHAAEIVDCLNLGHFHVFLKHDKKMKSTMEIRTDYTYLTAELSWGKNVSRLWKKRQYSSIVRCLCHELMHIVTGEETIPMSDRKLTKIETFFDERTTETVGRISYRLYWRWLKETKPKNVKKYNFVP